MKSEMIGVDRGGGLRSLMEMARRAPKEIRSGRQLIIFPEGTRTPVGAPPDYKTGVGQIYANSGVPCLPVALNSGLFWPRRTFMRYPGTLVVEFLDPLPPGLTRKDFIARIRTVIEDATNRLVEAARAEQAQLFGRVPSAATDKRLAAVTCSRSPAAIAGCSLALVVQHQRQLMQLRRRENLAPRSTSPSTARSRGCRRSGRGPAARSAVVRPATAARHIAHGRDRPHRPAR